MVLFGQSAGGMSVDFYAFAYTKDPIVHGLIPQSGTISGPPSRIASTGNGVSPAAIKNWSALSKELGCGEVSATDVSRTLSCMQSKPASAVLDATTPKTSGAAIGAWGPKADGKAVMSNTADRSAKGDFIRIPILVGNTNNEGASSGAKLGSPASKTSGCSSGQAAKVRRDSGVTAYRYLYSGEFPNQSLGSCCPNAEGAWHGAEIALIFGTTEFKADKRPINDTENEKKLSKTLRDAWSAFAKDPVHGLEKLGWPVYDTTKPSVVILGGKDSAEVTFQKPIDVDGTCSV